ncbi:MAG TPA: penicillin-binding protein activator LpoB [Fibrobacteres bacterium]|jgi:uncharacterized protein (TIGR02722 family)|nr:penicillin-binding protein activator LpoB [Fibrobacterota bacterium]
MTPFGTRISSLAVSVLLLSGCGTKVTRVSHDSTIDLSGEWNDTDSRLVAEEMVKDAVSANWYKAYETQKKIPRVVIGEIRNKSHEHINTETFINDIQRYLVNSGKVEFVANKAERKELRDEKSDQAQNSSVESQQMAGEESGAELMMLGEINSIVDSEGGKSVVFYQINLELVQIESHKKVWLGDKKIKKFVEKSASKL